MALTFGRQTVTVTDRVRGQHNAWTDGETSTVRGCFLQPFTQVEERLVDGRGQETLQWTLYAPAGFRAAPTAVCTVTPGPTSATGVPLRLAFGGTPQPSWDDKGNEVYVHAVLRINT